MNRESENTPFPEKQETSTKPTKLFGFHVSFSGVVIGELDLCGKNRWEKNHKKGQFELDSAVQNLLNSTVFFCATRQFLVEMKHELFVIFLFGMLNTNN